LAGGCACAKTPGERSSPRRRTGATRNCPKAVVARGSWWFHWSSAQLCRISAATSHGAGYLSVHGPSHDNAVRRTGNRSDVSHADIVFSICSGPTRDSLVGASGRGCDIILHDPIASMTMSHFSLYPRTLVGHSKPPPGGCSFGPVRLPCRRGSPWCGH